MSTPVAVLDASAVVAVLHRERGWKRVAETMSRSAISAVNWSEVAQRAAARGLDPRRARAHFTAQALTIVPFDAAAGEAAAELWPATRAAGLSLADRACLALASRLGVPALTADRAWTILDIGVDIQLVR